MNLQKCFAAGLAIGLSSVSAQADITTGLVSRYSFNGNFAETTGLGPVNAQNGATLAADRCGRATSGAFFPANGPPPYSSAYINCGNNTAVNVLNDTFSVAFWIKSSTDGNIIDKDIVGTVNGDWWISISGGGKPTFGLGSNSILVFPGNIANNTWHHLVFERNRSTGHARVYIDGMASADVTGAFNSVANASELHIGAWDTGNSSEVFREGFVGTIDEVRFYNRELTASDVAELIAFETCCNPPVTFAESFESNSAGVFPAGWESRLAGGGQGVVASPTWLGARAFRQVAVGLGAAESHTLPSWKSTSGTAVLDFALRMSSETTYVGGGCSDATVVYQGALGAMQCGFVGSGTSGWVIQGTNIPVQLDRWYQFHGVADYDKGTVSWYVDDALVVACQTMSPGSTDSNRTNRIESHVGCIDSGQMVAYLDSIRFTPAKACPWDADNSGALSVADVFAFLNGWFGGCP